MVRATRRLTMTQRLKAYHTLAPDSIKAMYALEASFASSSIEQGIRELVKLRASQINGCAFCIHMHATDLRKAGESEMRLYMLDAWRESSLYTDRERAALGWTEALTRIADTHAPDADYDALRAQFSDAEQVQLTLMIGAINAWNRLAIGFRAAHPADRVHADA
jgi:AhpD family alkylhydroperoxidase